MSMTDDEIRACLASPFDPKDVQFKPQATKGNRALAVAYANVRAVMDRLDDVVGPGNWEDDYEVLPDHSVICRLKVKFADRWVQKTDVGSPSEQPDGGDRLKAAFSDALKRAAVKLGVGRYVYRLPQQWCDYDPTKRQFVSPPRLPDWALPKGTKTPPPQQQSRPPVPQDPGLKSGAALGQPGPATDITEKAIEDLLREAGRTWEVVRPALAMRVRRDLKDQPLANLTQAERQTLVVGLRANIAAAKAQPHAA